MSPQTVRVCSKCGAILKLDGEKVQCQDCFQIVEPKTVRHTVWHGIAEAIEKQKQKREKEDK